MENLKREAEENLRLLAENTYPGRGIVLGRHQDGRLLQIYWIMGRSENSRNRIFVQEGQSVRTEPFDGSRMVDPSLVIYTAMNEVAGNYVVSNGDHTDVLCDVLASGGDYRQALGRCNHEPDEPHYTPRIAGSYNLKSGVISAWLAIIKSSPFDEGHSNRSYFEFTNIDPGFGWFISTYRGDGSPLPPFEGEPRLLPLLGDGYDVGEWIWNRLNDSNRISLALKIIDPHTGQSDTRLINKYG